MRNNTTFTLRASALPGFADCQRRFAAEQRGYARPAKSGLFAGTFHGSVVHKTVAKIVAGDEREWADIHSETFLEEYNPNATAIVWDSTTPSKADAHFQSFAAAKIIGRRLNGYGLAACEPQAVEQYMTCEMVSGCKLTGHLDILLEDGVLIDYKTGQRLTLYPPQLGAYAFMARENGYTVTAIEHWHLPRSKYADETMTIHQYDVDEAISIAERVIIAAADTRHKALADIIPNPASMLCSGKFCPIHGTPECVHGRIPKEER